MTQFTKPKSKLIQPRLPNTNNPVLLVHGIYDSGKRFKAIHTALVKYGFDPVVAMDITPNNGSIPFEAMAEQVGDAVLRILDFCGQIKIDIVGYSMGALAVRYYLQRLGGKSTVKRFISLSGPHHGTLSAHFHPWVACRQMRPGSQFLQNLNNDPDPFGDTEVYSFYTPYDLMVTPCRSAILERAHNRPFKVLLHFFMLSDKKVINAVVKTLAGEI